MDHSENDAPPTVRDPLTGDVAGVSSVEPPAELVGDAPSEPEEPGRGDAAPLETSHDRADALMDPGRVTTVFTASEPSAPATSEPTQAAPEPAPAATPEPVHAATPEPAQAATPGPAQAPTPEPAQSARPEPAQAATPEAAPATPEAAQAASPDSEEALSAESSQPVPAASISPETAPHAQPSASAQPDVPPAEVVRADEETAGASSPAAAAPVPDAAPVAEPVPAQAVEGRPPAPRPAARPAPSPAAIAQAEERKARAQQAWERVVNAHASGESLSGNVTTAVKGGLLVDIGGIRGFLPASQVRVAPGTALETLVRTKVPLKVIDVDTPRRRAVVSHRRAVDDDRRTKRADLLRSLVVGETREGVVVRLADFGAFVDLGGIDGLIPMRELAFERVEKVQDVLKVGDKLPVVVMRIEEGGKKISLSRKNALPDPWRDHAEVLRRDATVQGKVVGKEPRLQVELAPGIVGTVRESDANPADYEIGESIEVSVRSADRATRRITLTTMHGAAAAAVQTSATSTGFAPLGVELGRRP